MMHISSDAIIIDSVMRDFFSKHAYLLNLVKYAVMEQLGASTEGARIDFPDWNDSDEYYHFKGVKIVQFDYTCDWEDVVLVSGKELLEILLYYIDEFKKAHPKEKDPLITLAEEKIQKDLAAMQ